MGRLIVPEAPVVAVRMLGSIVIAAADPSFVHKCASDSITCQRFELWADVGESEVAKRRGNGVGSRMALDRGGWNRKRGMWRGKVGGC